MAYSRQRRSARLAGESPEIEDKPEDCFFCLTKVDICKVSVVLLPCCKKFAHRLCQKEWESTSTQCAHCRRDLPGFGRLERREQPARHPDHINFANGYVADNEDEENHMRPIELAIGRRHELARAIRNRLHDLNIVRRVREVSVVFF